MKKKHLERLNEPQIAGPFDILLNAGENTTIQFPWTVIDNNTTITVVIDNSSPSEYNYDDHEVGLQLGNLNVVIVSTPSCANQNNGSLTAIVNEGVSP